MLQCYTDLKRSFLTGKTRKVRWRKQQLSQLLLAFSEMEKLLTKALKVDMGREEFTSFLTEVSIIKQKAQNDLNNLDNYMKVDKRDTPLIMAPAISRVIYQPLGAV